jgi:hypothetical protein
MDSNPSVASQPIGRVTPIHAIDPDAQKQAQRPAARWLALIQIK